MYEVRKQDGKESQDRDKLMVSWHDIKELIKDGNVVVHGIEIRLCDCKACCVWAKKVGQ